MMESYEHDKWHEEIKKCFIGSSGEMSYWEDIINNLAIFFLKHERGDVARLLFQFIIQYGQFPRTATYNLCSSYVSEIKYLVDYGLQAKSPPVDVSKLSEGKIHPDALVNELSKLKDLFEYF